MIEPSIDLMKQHLRYEPSTGLFWWTQSGYGRNLGIPAGTRSGSGAKSVNFEKRAIRCSKVAWAFVYGVWPDRYVEHINGSKSDDRICNLQLHEYYVTPKPNLTNKQIRELFLYDPETGMIQVLVCGEWIHRESRDQKKNGTNTFYMSVCCKSNRFLSHRLAWFLHYDRWPKKLIDHKNQDGCDNRIENLREVTHGENIRNSRRSKANKSGVTGVSWSRLSKKWFVQITFNGESMYLGTYSKLEDAARVRREAEEHFGFSKTHGRAVE